MQFSASVYEVLNYNQTGPNIVMFDTLFAQENHYPTVTIQERRTGCAQMAIMGTIICIGGTSFPLADRALPFVDETQILPAPSISLDQSDQFYNVGGCDSIRRVDVWELLQHATPGDITVV